MYASDAKVGRYFFYSIGGIGHVADDKIEQFTAEIGLLQSLLCVRLPRGGVWIAALLFGAAHFRWEAFPALVLLGVVLGAGYNRHGYWGSALLHALYNAAVLVLSAREPQISVITMVLFVAAFCFALRGYLEKEEPDETDSSGL